MNKFSHMAATSVTMQKLYLDVFQPLFFPSPAEFAQPLLDSFVAAHDGLLDDNTLFSIPARTRETGVLIDGATRELRRREASSRPAQRDDSDQASLGEVQRLRLRARLQTVSSLPCFDTRPFRMLSDRSMVGQQAGPLLQSREQILRESRERVDKLERELRLLEEAALKEFKEGIRRAVAMTAK